MVLVVCVACDRFVRVTEARCPFCGAARSSTSNADDPVAPKIGAPRLSRAALVLAGTAAVAACGKNTDTPDSGRIREPDVYVAAPPYGAVPTEQPDPEPPPPPPLDAGRKIHAPPYGMPPRRDAGRRKPGDPFDDF